MLPGETVTSGAPLPYDDAMPDVLKSRAGHYIGYQDAFGLPYSRETHYMSRTQAIEALNDGSWKNDPWIRR